MLVPLSPRGWTVEFGVDVDGAFQILDYCDGTNHSCDPEFPMSPKHVDRLDGLIQQIRYQGPTALKFPEQWKPFKGEDGKNGGCELRLKSHRGHRLLCFRRSVNRFVIACAFRKPNQPETPPQEQERAEAILAAHEQRMAAPTRKLPGHR